MFAGTEQQPMTRVLLGTASVHTTAAACDYLTARLGAGDTVVVLTVREAGLERRDAGDAANVARTRLFEPSVETHTREGEPAREIRDAATDHDVDEIVIGPHRGHPQTAGEPPGSTARALLAALDRPVVVVPV
jgi:nucleotide-binding universal stress UspA family protein